MANPIPKDVLAVLDRCATDGQHLKLPTGQLARTLYIAVNKVLESAGGKWNRKTGSHLFPSDVADAMEQILLTGEVHDFKQELQQFFTPQPLADRIVVMAGVNAGHDVLEPSAGTGTIALGARALCKAVTCIELDTKLYAGLALHRDQTFEVRNADFMLVPQQPVFDRIVMNPPFSKFADIKHVSHALEFLRPGGVLVSIMSLGTMDREAKIACDFRSFVDASGGMFERLPEKSFRESGTDVSTCVVTIPYTREVRS